VALSPRNLSWVAFITAIAESNFRYTQERIGANGRVQNALRNSDNQNARIEHDRAVDDELLGSLVDHTDLYAPYNTDKVFKAWLQ
jgi:hypothetical protein